MDDNAITQASEVYNGGLHKQCIAGTNSVLPVFQQLYFFVVNFS